jgi:hypothetical protein
VYSSAEVTVSPWRWVDFTGQFFDSQPNSDVRFSENAQGTLLWLETLRFVSGQQSLVTGYANQPRTSGAGSVEVRPWSRVRILESWQTTRMHNAASLAGLTTLDQRSAAGAERGDRLVWNESEQQVQAWVDVAKFLTLQGAGTCGAMRGCGGGRCRRGQAQEAGEAVPGTWGWLVSCCGWRRG